MSETGYVNSFRDLIVYRKSRQLAKDIFEATQTFPREEMYSLTDQIRRSSRSIGAQIAEAWAKRLYERHFVSKLTDADGEQQATQHWLDVALDCHYLNTEQSKCLSQSCVEIGRMLGCMLSQSDRFCKPSAIRESAADYSTDSLNTDLLITDSSEPS